MATFVKTPANDLVLILSPAEAKALATLASMGAAGLRANVECSDPDIIAKYAINAGNRALKTLSEAAQA